MSYLSNEDKLIYDYIKSGSFSINFDDLNLSLLLEKIKFNPKIQSDFLSDLTYLYILKDDIPSVKQILSLEKFGDLTLECLASRIESIDMLDLFLKIMPISHSFLDSLCFYGKTNLIKYIFEQPNFDLDFFTERNFKLLKSACSEDQSNVVKYFLENKNLIIPLARIEKLFAMSCFIQSLDVIDYFIYDYKILLSQYLKETLNDEILNKIKKRDLFYHLEKNTLSSNDIENKNKI